MSAIQDLRVMWLLNHTSARRFEIPMLKRVGISRIFLPKLIPENNNFRSSTVDWSEDDGLDIPAAELEVLNAQNWYRDPSAEAISIANKYFDVAFFILHDSELLRRIASGFKGVAIWRAYGLDSSLTYGDLLRACNADWCIRRLGRRFYFGEAYAHLGDVEGELIRRRRCFLPLGLSDCNLLDNWKGSERHIYFVCPEVGFNPYYRRVYDEFRRDFDGLRYVVAGAQPVAVHDPNVLGFVTSEEHAYNMAQSRVMFYHSREPNHIHYHPFEAIRAGMPLVFMGGGMLDRMGGLGLPGRCQTVAEARRKIERILNDDWELIERIRSSQTVLLEEMRAERCEPAWRDGFARIAEELTQWRAEQEQRPKIVRRKRIAVILPVEYRGGTLRGAQVLARALHLGSRQWGEDADVVFFYPDDQAAYPASEFSGLSPEILRRPFRWKRLTASEARRAMRYAGYESWEPTAEHYIIPDDGMRQGGDCDLWLIVSDRLLSPLLPVRPFMVMVYDYLQRYEAVLPSGVDAPFIAAARSAERVLVTTEFTYRDALQYAGVDPRKIAKVPVLPPEFTCQQPLEPEPEVQSEGYFIWTTNSAPHKNHVRAAEALQIYYEDLGGELKCRITGVNTANMLASDQPHLKAMAGVFARSKRLRDMVDWLGELPDSEYRRTLARSRFLWHAGRVDNGTFSVIEAACCGVPALSSNYPAMREMDTHFSLNLAWMDADDPRDMAEQIKMMEKSACERRALLPTAAVLRSAGLESHAHAYWKEVRGCL